MAVWNSDPAPWAIGAFAWIRIIQVCVIASMEWSRGERHFRPFAPAVTLRQAATWFDIARAWNSLIYDHDCECLRGISFTIASRGSCRRFSEVTVSSADNPEFHSLLEAFGRLTGQEIVLNTSFNVKGQLFVNTPESGDRNLPWLWH